jgi:hypothetical protein
MLIATNLARTTNLLRTTSMRLGAMGRNVASANVPSALASFVASTWVATLPTLVLLRESKRNKNQHCQPQPDSTFHTHPREKPSIAI